MVYVEVRPERLPAKITDPSIDVYRDGSVDDGHNVPLWHAIRV